MTRSTPRQPREAGRERVVGERLIDVALDADVRAEPDDLVLDLAAEPAHDHQREQERRHAERHAPDRGVRDEAEEAPPLVAALRPAQVAERDEALEGGGGASGHAERSAKEARKVPHPPSR